MRYSDKDSSRFIKDVRDLSKQENIVGLEVQFTEEPLGNKNSVIKHAVIHTDATTTKLVILITRLTVQEMAVILDKLKEITTELNIPGTWAEAEESRLYAKQFDFVLFGIPALRADDIREYYLKRIKKLYD